MVIFKIGCKCYGPMTWLLICYDKVLLLVFSYGKPDDLIQNDRLLEQTELKSLECNLQ